MPNSVTIDAYGVTIQVPGILGDDEVSIPFDEIAEIGSHKPLIGFSSIIIGTSSESVYEIDGFSKYEVETMKELIEACIAGDIEWEVE